MSGKSVQNEPLCKAIKLDIQDIKRQVDNLEFDPDQLVQESIQAKIQWEKEKEALKLNSKEVKRAKKGLKNKAASAEKLEVPLKFLKANRHLVEANLDFLRSVTLNLVQSIEIKDKQINNIKAQNENLAQRIKDLSGQEPDLEVFKRFPIENCHPIV